MPIGIRVNIDGSFQYFTYGQERTAHHFEHYIQNKGHIIIELEKFEFWDGYYLFYGYVSGNVHFNRYQLKTCLPKGDIIILRFNLNDTPRHMNIDEFREVYEILTEAPSCISISNTPTNEFEYSISSDEIIRDLIINPYQASRIPNPYSFDIYEDEN